MKKRSNIVIICVAVIVALLTVIIIRTASRSSGVMLPETEVETVVSDTTHTTNQAVDSWVEGQWLCGRDGTEIPKLVFCSGYEGATTDVWEYDGKTFYMYQARYIYVDISKNNKIVGSMSKAFQGMTALTEVTGLERLDVSGVSDFSYLFCGTAIEKLNLTTLNFQEADTFQGMMKSCPNLTSVSFAGCDLSHVKNMSYMFDACPYLGYIDFTDCVLDLDNAEGMFYRTGANVGTFIATDYKVFKVINAKAMFYNSNIINLNDIIADLDTSEATTMELMFSGYITATLDLSAWDVSNVVTMRGMFAGPGITEIILDGWDVSSLEDCSSMFDEATSVSNLVLNWKNTDNIKYTDRMFYECFSLETLDLSCFDGLTFESSEEMFVHCEYLTTIYGEGFDTLATWSMFNYCHLLPGYTDNDFGSDRANSKEGGFFTAK